MTSIEQVKKDINESCRLAREVVLFLEKESKGNTYIASQTIVILYEALKIERKKERTRQRKKFAGEFFSSENFAFLIGASCLIISIIYVWFKLPV